jgi:hypothetical protein
MTADELEWEDPPPVQGKYGRVQEFVFLLSTRPGQWARYPHPYSPGSVRYMVSKYPRRHAGTEWCSRRIDGESVLFARWVGDV